jgi:redox-sensitive bicupin YhaK (pirin superfamily)
MSSTRKIKQIYKGRETIEGAGVRLDRVFGYREVPRFDPFLMLDDFGSKDPDDYMAGFPWHPHRGIETVTYMLHGTVKHGDSMGNKGEISDGQVQWMTAGSGIIHQEMPVKQEDYLRGFQLWVNLPASHKMMPPRYQDIKATDIPEHSAETGIKVKVISGHYHGTVGPVKGIIGNPEYLDIYVPADKKFEHVVPKGHTVFAYAIAGEGYFDADKKKVLDGFLVLYGDGEKIAVETVHVGVRFLLVSGKPIEEPIAWRGPIVMNTEEELDRAFREFHDGTFIKR